MDIMTWRADEVSELDYVIKEEEFKDYQQLIVAVLKEARVDMSNDQWTKPKMKEFLETLY